MTWIERKEQELARLLADKAKAIRRNDVCWLASKKKRIAELEAQIAEYKSREPLRLSDVLRDRDPEVKDKIYHKLLRISLLADVVNDAAKDALQTLRELGLEDFAFRANVVEIDKLSKKVSDIVLIPKATTLEDFIVDNDEVVDGCIEIADKYIAKKLNLK